MNDLLRLQAEPCGCGSPLQAVAEVAGRMDDCFEFFDPSGARIRVTPDVIRNAILGASHKIMDFRAVQTSSGEVTLSLPPVYAGELPSAAGALVALFDRLGARPQIRCRAEPLPSPCGIKLRRVIRERAIPT